MSKTKRIVIIAIAAVLLAIVSAGATYMICLSSAPAPQEPANENAPVENTVPDEGNTSNTEGGGASTTVEDITEETIPEPVDHSSELNAEGVYIPDQSGTNPEITARNMKLEQMDQEAMKNMAVDIVFRLRNFTAEELQNNWTGRFSAMMDSGMASQDRDNNILYKETQPAWAEACGSYSEYKNKTRSIDVTSIYMDQQGSQQVPVVTLTVVEDSCADYPMNGSDHWKPINVVSSTYFVYFTPDGSFVYNVKSIDKTILEKNVNAYPFDENAMYEGEGAYYN